MQIYVNQAGYLPKSRKAAVLAQEPETGQNDKVKIRVLDSQGRCAFEKEAVYFGVDEASGDSVWQADFSELEKEGCYQIADDQGQVSCHFKIAVPVYRELNRILCKAFYFQRCGMELEETYAGVFKRESCHEGRAVLLEDYLAGKSGQTYDVRGGWHDAGDYGRYTTAAATALAHMLYAWEWFPDSFQDSLNIPESGNGMDDILNECLYELRWLLKMQMEDGSVRHKLTSMRHANFVMPCRDKRQMILFPPSSMAAGAFAAVMALASRIYARFDRMFSESALQAAEKAWDWLEKHPGFLGFENPDGCNTGGYEDDSDKDERLWAAAELYRCTKDPAYLRRAEEFLGQISKKTAFGWADVAGLAGWALLEEDLKHAGSRQAADCDMEERLKKQYRECMISEAEQFKMLGKGCGYMAAMKPDEYEWGSNMVLLNRGMLFAVSYMMSGRKEFLECAQEQMDYLLGVNAAGYSYVTGAGEHAFQNPHNRVTVSDQIAETIPGFVSGGANSRPVDEKAEWLIEPGTPPMKCYLDIWECYSLNEITIYWNSPAVFLAAFLDSVKE